MVSSFTFQNSPLISFYFHDFLSLMTCDAPCCARRFPMYLSMCPHQTLIDSVLTSADFSYDNVHLILELLQRSGGTNVKQRIVRNGAEVGV